MSVIATAGFTDLGKYLGEIARTDVSPVKILGRNVAVYTSDEHPIWVVGDMETGRIHVSIFLDKGCTNVGGSDIRDPKSWGKIKEFIRLAQGLK